MTPVNIWNALYRNDVPPEQTARECDFIEHFMPHASYPHLLDLACDTGRHTLELAARGYNVTGVDVDPKALEVGRSAAERQGVAASFVEADLRQLDLLAPGVDGIILIWQSFGFFDDEAQIGIFQELRRLLRNGGRIVLDLYNRLHFVHGVESPGAPSTEVHPALEWSSASPTPLGYEEDLGFEAWRAVELFDPHMFTPGEMSGLAVNYGLHLVASCSLYSPDIPATPEHSRMQLVFEKR